MKANCPIRLCVCVSVCGWDRDRLVGWVSVALLHLLKLVVQLIRIDFSLTMSRASFFFLFFFVIFSRLPFWRGKSESKLIFLSLPLSMDWWNTSYVGILSCTLDRHQWRPNISWKVDCPTTIMFRVRSAPFIRQTTIQFWRQSGRYQRVSIGMMCPGYPHTVVQ